jgi:hypothetical protein
LWYSHHQNWFMNLVTQTKSEKAHKILMGYICHKTSIILKGSSVLNFMNTDTVVQDIFICRDRQRQMPLCSKLLALCEEQLKICSVSANSYLTSIQARQGTSRIFDLMRYNGTAWSSSPCDVCSQHLK